MGKLGSPSHSSEANESALFDRLEQNLETIIIEWDQYFPGFDKRPYQIEKLKKLLAGLRAQTKGEIDPEKVLADITPPAGGKTFIMAMLAKIMLMEGIPSIICMRNKNNIDGPDNAFNLYKHIFGEENVGIVTGLQKDFTKPITLITSHSFAKKALEFAHHEKINLMIDESDTFQTDLRQDALDLLSKDTNAYRTTYSATTLLCKRHISKWAHIVDEMPLIDLIRLGYAKHIVGRYYTGDITINDEQVGGGDVLFDKLKRVEQKWLVESCYKLYAQHMGEKTMIHCQSVEQAKMTHEIFKKMGVASAYVVEETKKQEREKIENDYVHGDIKVLISVDIYGRGFSEKGVTENEIIALISGSLSRIYQLSLRGVRPHTEHDTLRIYQLIPSTILTRQFKPVLLHECFNFSLKDLYQCFQTTDMMTQDSGKGSNKAPITFSATEGDTQNPDITYVSYDTIVDVVSTKGEELQEKITRYIRDNLINILDQFMKKTGLDIFYIASCNDPENRDHKIDIVIDGQQVQISFDIVRSCVFSLISGLNKSQGKGFSAIATSRVQKRYIYGRPALEESLQHILDSGTDKIGALKKLSQSHVLFRKEFILEHGLKILEELYKTHPNLSISGNLEKVSITYEHQLEVSYRELTGSILSMLTGMSGEEANGFQLVGHNIAKQWYTTKIKPTTTEALTILCKDGLFNRSSYFKDNFGTMLDSFLAIHGLGREDLGRCSINHDDTITVTLEYDAILKHVKEYNPKYAKFIPKDMQFQVQYIWRNAIETLINTYISLEYIQKRGLDWHQAKKFPTHKIPVVIDHILDGSLTEDVLDTIRTEEYPLIPNAKDYALVKDIENITQTNAIDIGIGYTGAAFKKFCEAYPTIKIPGREEELSAKTFLNTWLIVICGMQYKEIEKKWGVETTRVLENLTVTMFMDYMKTSADTRKLFTEKYLYNTYIGKPNTNFQDIVFPIGVPIDLDLHNSNDRETFCDAISDSLFPSIEILESYGLTREIYKALYAMLHDFAIRDRLCEDVISFPTSFLNHRIQKIIERESVVVTPKNKEREVEKQIRPTTEELKETLTAEEDKKKTLKFIKINHTASENLIGEDLTRKIYQDFFKGEEHTARNDYFEELSYQRTHLTNYHKKAKINGGDESVSAFHLQKNFVKRLEPYIEGIRDELSEAGYFLSDTMKYAFYNAFFKKNVERETLLSDILLGFKENISFVSVCKKILKMIFEKEEDTVAKQETIEQEEQGGSEKDGIIENTSQHEETQINESVPSFARFQTILKSIVSDNKTLKQALHKWDAFKETSSWDEKLLHFIDTRFHKMPNLESIFKECNEIHNVMLYKEYRETYEDHILSKNDLSIAIEAKDYEKIKTHCICIYVGAERGAMNAKRNEKFTRDHAKEIRAVKDQLTEYEVYYDTFLNTISTSLLAKLGGDKIKGLSEKLTYIYDYIKLID